MARKGYLIEEKMKLLDDDSVSRFPFAKRRWTIPELPMISCFFISAIRFVGWSVGWLVGGLDGLRVVWL